MSESLDFMITFHSPFRVSTGRAGGGLDATVDLDDPLPASSLKGLMRDAATTVLRADPALIGATFGSPSNPSPWTWTGAEPLDDSGSASAWQSSSVQTRVVIDAETHTVVEDLIMFGEVVEHRQARFVLYQTGWVAAGEIERHRALLRAAGAAVHQLGAQRTRGLGWVSVRPDDGEVTADELAHIGVGSSND